MLLKEKLGETYYQKIGDIPFEAHFGNFGYTIFGVSVDNLCFLFNSLTMKYEQGTVKNE